MKCNTYKHYSLKSEDVAPGITSGIYFDFINLEHTGLSSNIINPTKQIVARLREYIILQHHALQDNISYRR